ncbi:MAG: hypothetical protein AB8G96_01575 [Phycisphaerales bacterium]
MSQLAADDRQLVVILVVALAATLAICLVLLAIATITGLGRLGVLHLVGPAPADRPFSSDDGRSSAGQSVAEDLRTRLAASRSSDAWNEAGRRLIPSAPGGLASD